MGLDVQFYIKPFVKISAEQFKEIQEKFYDKYPDPNSHVYPPSRYPEMDWGDNMLGESPAWIVIRGLDRFYGIGYERGNWPYIKEMGDWLAVNFGETGELLYGNDCENLLRFVQWGKIRDKLSQHWEDVGNAPYYER